MQNKLLLIFLVFFVCACKTKEKEEKTEKQLVEAFTEQYRPQFHFTPEEKWMNDPNGLVYHEGTYHLFFQYYPDDIVWGPMHWGHAISTDMVHWEHKPIALYPDGHGLIFSGSAVVDKENTSGFGKDGKPPLVAIFTYHSMEGEKAGRNDFQTQGIAYSLDNGATWTKYEGNPVIGNEGIRDFRDPKVFWHEGSQSWVLVLVAGDHARFYTSKNLREWEYRSSFGKNQGAHGGVWECPDLFPLFVEGEEEPKWVLLISINPGAPNGGSGTQYFVGEFDGNRFISDQKEPKWLDYGTDNYAGVTYNNVPNDDRIFIGWMSNWDYARDTPTKKWRSAMTLPRRLTLGRHKGEYLLANYPLPQIATLAATELLGSTKISTEGAQTFSIANLNQSQIRLRTASKDFELVFKNDMGETLELTMDSNSNAFLLDRMNSGQVNFQPEFGNKKHYMPIEFLTDGHYEIDIYLDWSSIEVFLDRGLLAMTDQIFPSQPYTALEVHNNDGEEAMELVFVKKMPSIWP
ncbi:glycoside hydrolase family 32 protein [Flagellimonas meishanensis]|uniref:glycoside hydrolase family 32 protein n=1 Tax=Flagellimonas meishanensis TaxID=2873264 RepID=UPI001CA758D7|nr:glycoside hydrolase family 32 protein [[Muricauda] meishanensis]